MEEGIFGEWLKSPGEMVCAGEMVFLLEGEKAAHEIESFDAGILCVPADAPRPGETVKVGQVIGFLLADGEVAPVTVGPKPSQVQAAAVASERHSPAEKKSAGSSTVIASGEQRVAGPAARRLARQLGVDLNAVSTPDPTGRVLCEDIERTALRRVQQVTSPVGQHAVASPRARRRAQELGVDWRLLSGSGRNGRIRERDVLALQTATDHARPSSSMELRPTVPGRHRPASKVRLALARRMTAGLHSAAPVTITTTVDASALVAHREHLRRAASSAIVPSYNDLLIHLTAITLRDQPQLNACWLDDGVYEFDEINIAVAVDTDFGLLAPVIPHADQLTVMEIAETSRELIASARAGRLTQKQLDGGTMTTSNLGSFGVDAFTPILNLPQAAILGIGRLRQEAVVRDSQLAVGHMLTLSLTFDHRVIDGAPAARWLQRLTERIGRLPAE